MRIANSIPKTLCIGLLALPAVASFAAPTVTSISAGYAHVLFVESDGSMWGMGYTGDGELGQGFVLILTNYPIQILASNVNTVAAGLNHSLFLETDGSLWAMGDNTYGELGDGMIANHYFPEKIVPSGVTTISAGGQFSLYRTVTGHPITTIALWGMGRNIFDELGVGTIYDGTNVPVLCQSTQFILDEVVAFDAGNYSSFVIREDGSLWATGLDSFGELGDGHGITPENPEEIVSNSVLAVSSGTYHTLFIKNDGGLWAMGADKSGQLGDNTNVLHRIPEQVGVNAMAIAAGGAHSLFIKADGSLWGMGSNGVGQVGDGTTIDRHVPVQIVSSNVVAVAAGDQYSLFVKSDGSLWGMGDNTYGQLGDGSFNAQHAPIRIVPPPPSPAITNLTLSGNNVVLSGTNGMSGGTYYTLMSTNMALPRAQWTAIATNVLDADGGFIITAANAANRAAGQQFFIIQLAY